MVPRSLASFAAITFTGRYFNRFGPRPLVIIGCLLQAMGIMLLLKIDADSPLALLILAFTLMGGGGSLCSSTAQSSAFLHTPAEERCLTPARYGILTASSASLPAAPCSPCC